MQKRIAVALTLVAVGVLGLLLWTRSTSQPAANTVAPARETAVTAETKAPGLVGTPDKAENGRRVVPESASTPAAESAPDAVSASGSAVADSTLIVHVVGKPGGTPLSSVRVSVFPRNRANGVSSAEVDGTRGTIKTSPTTGKEGTVEFDLPSGTGLYVHAFAKSQDAGDAEADVPALGKGEKRQLVLEMPLGEDLVFHCVLLASDTRAPIAGAKVSIVQRTESMFGTEDESHADDTNLLGTVTSEPDGHAAVSMASWKYPYLQIEADGFSPINVPPQRGHEDREHALVLSLDQGATLAATIVDLAGSPLSDVNVRAKASIFELLPRNDQPVTSVTGNMMGDTTWSGATDGDGHCTLRSLPSNVALQVEVLRGSRVLKGKGEAITLKPGEVRSLRLQIGSGCTVTGELVDEKNEPIAKHEIWLMHAEGGSATNFSKYMASLIDWKTVTDQRGRFQFMDVAPGQWVLGPAGESDPWSEPAPDALASPVQTVDIAPAAQSVVVTIRTQRGLFIRGQVVDSNGSPVDDAHVSVELESGLPVTMTDTKRDGHFVLGPLMPGHVSLTADAHEADAKSAPLLASAGDTDIVLKLRAGGSIQGRIADANGTWTGDRVDLHLARNGAPIYASEFVLTKDDGTFERRGIEPGVYCLTAATHDGRIAISRGIVVSARENVRDLVLTLQQASKLRVQSKGASSVYWCVARSEGAVVAYGGGHTGQVSVLLVPSGTLTLEMLHDPTAKPLLREITVAAGEEKEIVFTDDG
jgi:Carboxypeptidase regulatory-like domain